MAAHRKYINPMQERLHLSEVSYLFDLQPNTIRQHIRRGAIPEPVVRRGPELGWGAATIYTWAYGRDLIPLAAVPFRHLRYVIDHSETRGAPAPQVHEAHVTTPVEHEVGGGQVSGVQVRYGGLTDEGIGFTLSYPFASGELRPEPGRAGIVVQVTGHVSVKGFYVDVYQEHPGYEYANDTEVRTFDVAQLVQEAIPYWPRELRCAIGAVDRSTGHVLLVEEATATPSYSAVRRGAAVERFAQAPEHESQHELTAALCATVAADYRSAARAAQEDIDQYVAPVRAHSWALTDPTRHLVLAATPADAAEETLEEDFARSRLRDLVWQTPVGDTPPARQLAASVADVCLNVFALDSQTGAQRAFRAALVPLQPEEATLIHLAFTHPKRGHSPDARSIPRTYWRDDHSGAYATIFDATDGAPAYCCYEVPREYPEPIDPLAFDFEDDHQPFVWAGHGAALPFPRGPETGYALGHGDRGPRAVKAMVARLLGLDPHTAVTARWPFFSRGYPVRVSAEEMRGYYQDGRGL